MRKFVGFIPEAKFDEQIARRVKLSPGLFLLSKNHINAIVLTLLIEELGYQVNEGVFIYFEGDLKENEETTAYEIFQGYCLALTFFYKDGRATCRAIKELETDKRVELYIDEADQFRFDPDDEISLSRGDLKRIEKVYGRVEEQLSITEFNPLRNSIEFFLMFLRENQIRIRLLYLTICLEGVFLDGDNQEINHKLSLRCAKFLNKFDSTIEPRATFHEVKNGYKLRSKIIHGDDYAKESSSQIRSSKNRAGSEIDHVLILERIVKNMYHFVFLDQDIYTMAVERKLGVYIDENYILEKT